MAEQVTVKVNGKDVRVYKRMPKGWKKDVGAMTQPVGTVWINNGKSLFAKDENGKSARRSALLITDKELFEERKKAKKTTAKATPKKPTAKKATKGKPAKSKPAKSNKKPVAKKPATAKKTVARKPTAKKK